MVGFLRRLLLKDNYSTIYLPCMPTKYCPICRSTDFEIMKNNWLRCNNCGYNGCQYPK